MSRIKTLLQKKGTVPIESVMNDFLDLRLGILQQIESLAPDVRQIFSSVCSLPPLPSVSVQGHCNEAS